MFAVKNESDKEGMTVADVKVSKQSSQAEPRPRGLARRGEWLPGAWALRPRDFFSLSPFEIMRRFNDEMDRFLAGHDTGEMVEWTPSIEVREKDNNLIVSADLPGLSKDDIKVEATDEGLAIHGERKIEHEERREGMYRSERRYGRFPAHNRTPASVVRGQVLEVGNRSLSPDLEQIVRADSAGPCTMPASR
jgi:HSP20 family protein